MDPLFKSIKTQFEQIAAESTAHLVTDEDARTYRYQKRQAFHARMAQCRYEGNRK